MPRSDQGISKDRYHLIPRTLIFVMDQDRVLLLKGAPTKRLWANKYNGIGGHIERGEDVLSAGYRELYEETGLRNVLLSLAGTLIVDSGENTGVVIFILRGDYQSGELHPSSEGDLGWFNVNELTNLPLVEDLRILLVRLQEMGPGDPPFSSRSFYDEQEQLQVKYFYCDQRQ